MIQFLNLMRTTTKCVLIAHNIRSFASLHQNSRTVIRNTNFNFNTIITRRIKTNRILREKVKSEAKPPKVKLKSSDLKRLLALAKSEKWKIAGENLLISQKSL